MSYLLDVYEKDLFIGLDFVCSKLAILWAFLVVILRGFFGHPLFNDSMLQKLEPLPTYPIHNTQEDFCRVRRLSFAKPFQTI